MSYLGTQGLGQVRLLLDRRPLEEVLADPATSERDRRQLRLIPEIKAFGEQELGLVRTDNYTTWVKVPDGGVAWLLTACPPDSVEPHTWSFPIVGTVPYLGFFSLDDALAEQHRLKTAGWDTYLRGVSAYSTLGFFSDPVFSTFTRWPDHDLADNILHETTHATVWLPGDVPSNEAFASFVGERGSLLFLRHRFGPDSPKIKAALDSRADAVLFSDLVLELHADLRRIFALDVPKHEKLLAKRAVFAKWRARFRREQPRFRSKRIARLDQLDWNNALVASFAVYRKDVAIWEAALEALDGDLKAVIVLAKEAAKTGKPREYMAEWLSKR